MKKTVLYIAMSLDGYIADANGGVAWLVGDGSEPENQGSYPEFIKTVDPVIMGYKTYHQVTTELSPDQWVYPDKKTYVLTHRNLESSAPIIFTNQNIETLIAELKNEAGLDIWICGGASIINQLIEADLIDRYWITVIPTILGKGIRLFETLERQIDLELIKAESYNGMTDLIYERRNDNDIKQ